MPKRCILCDDDARYAIKDTSNYYCEECAVENFSDVALLVQVEEMAQMLKSHLDDLESQVPESDM